MSTYYCAVLDCGYEAAQERRTLSDTLNAWAFFFFLFLCRSVALLGTMLHFNSFFFDSRMIQMPYFHSCAKVVSTFLLFFFCDDSDMPSSAFYSSQVIIHEGLVYFAYKPWWEVVFCIFGNWRVEMCSSTHARAFGDSCNGVTYRH